MTKTMIETVARLLVDMQASDRQLERLYGWPRGAVRQFINDNPNPAWRILFQQI